MTPERRRGLGVKLVYDLLRNEILDLCPPPGSPVDEVQLAGAGLIETLPNRQTMVSNIDMLNLHHFFDALTLMYRVTTRLPAQNHRAAVLQAIRAHQQSCTAAVAKQDPLAMIAANRDFHAAMADAGGAAYYTRLFKRLPDEGRRILRLYYQSKSPQHVDEHERIIESIIASDVAAADHLAKAHADQVATQIRQLFAQDRRQDIAL